MSENNSGEVAEQARDREMSAGADPEELSDSDGIFSGLVGQKGAKAVVRGALRSGNVDVLLCGPPASGKSTMLEAIEDNVPGTVYRDGKRFTATRIQSTFADDPPILLIDEIDALTNDEFDVLSNPMEHGRVTEDTHDETYDIEVGTQVIAACNSAERIPSNIRSRFREVPFKGYSAEEMADVCAVMLPEKVEWVEDAEMGRQVGEIVHDETGSTDPRDARDVAYMVSSIEEVEIAAAGIQDADADVESDPLAPEDVARAQTEVGREKLRDMVRNGQVDQDDIDEQIERAVEKRLEKRD